MIDTPVGRLDRSHRMNLVTRYFPAASRQVVLLSTDEEIVGEYLDHLDPYIGKSYILEYDDTADSTSIREGYFA
jgi:DNA sulfur modification protein DndD